jgi:hypothetical protein
MAFPASSLRGILWAGLFCAIAGCDDASSHATAATATSAAASTGGGGVPPSGAGLGDWTCEAGELELDDGTCLPAGIPPGEYTDATAQAAFVNPFLQGYLSYARSPH